MLYLIRDIFIIGSLVRDLKGGVGVGIDIALKSTNPSTHAQVCTPPEADVKGFADRSVECENKIFIQTAYQGLLQFLCPQNNLLWRLR